MSSILIRTAVIVLLLALLGFGTGLLFGAIWGWSFFSLGLIGLLAHHVWHLRLLRQWRGSRCRPTDHHPRASAGIRQVRRGRRVLQAPAAEDDAGRPRSFGAVRSLRRLAAVAAFARHYAGARAWRPCAGTSSRTF